MLVFRDDHFSRKTKYSQPCFLSIFTLFSPNFTEFQRFFAKKKKNGGIPFLCKSPPTMPDHLNSLTYNIWTKAYSISFWFLVFKKTNNFIVNPTCETSSSSGSSGVRADFTGSRPRPLDRLWIGILWPSMAGWWPAGFVTFLSACSASVWAFVRFTWTS